MPKSSSFYQKHQPLTIAQELLIIGQLSELGMAFVNEFMPLGPAKYPRIDQQACLERIKEKMKNKDKYYVDAEGHPQIKAFEPEAKTRHDLFGYDPLKVQSS